MRVELHFVSILFPLNSQHEPSVCSCCLFISLVYREEWLKGYFFLHFSFPKGRHKFVNGYKETVGKRIFKSEADWIELSVVFSLISLKKPKFVHEVS